RPGMVRRLVAAARVARMTDQARRRLVWHGVLLYLVGLLMGTVTYALANPRMGLSAHVGTLVNGIQLIALGAGWDAAALSPRAEHAGFWLLVVSSYGGVVRVVRGGA